MHINGKTLIRPFGFGGKEVNRPWQINTNIWKGGGPSKAIF